ncbi:MAG TPA: MmcQ/YjbR family DNA-binding protein [Thermoanaerobaculia bacterium]|nr:MmcQ/YjbR family DNA-binding protein [Thermoanaerobaculia bacterium]
MALVHADTEERPHFDRQAFRTPKRIFATLQPERRIAILMIPVAEDDTLVGSRPGVFSRVAWGARGFLQVDLRRVRRRELEPLLEQAWRLAASTEALRRLDRAP